jgi:hypothetical protein
MQNNEFGKLFNPPAGSRIKFKSKLDSVIIQDQRDMAAIRVFTGALAIVTGLFAFMPPLNAPKGVTDAVSFLSVKSPATHESTEISGSAIEYQTSTPGIRLYWVFR